MWVPHGRHRIPHCRMRWTLDHVTNGWLVPVIVADLTQCPVLLEERPDTLIAHPQRDPFPAAPTVDLEIDHRTVFPLVGG
jgi:hypothetical protein